MRIHQSTIAQAEICSYRVKFDIDPDVPKSTSVSAAIGTAYHKAMEVYYGWKGEFPIEIMPESMIDAATQALQDEVDKYEDFSWVYQAETAKVPRIELDMDTALMKLQEAITRYLVEGHAWIDWRNDDGRYKVRAVEWSFELPLNDHHGRGGTIDLALDDGETHFVVIVDHKTSKKKWKAGKGSAASSPQAPFYSGAAVELFGTPNVAFVYDVMGLDDGSFDRIDASVTPRQIDATLGKAELVSNMILKEAYIPNTGSYLCTSTWCRHWKRCPFGAALNEG